MTSLSFHQTSIWSLSEWISDTVTYPNGAVYKGELINKKPHGTGFILHRDGSSYRGQWLNGFWNGEGVENVSGEVYDGFFVDERRTGFGKCVYGDGRVYEGSWRED